MDEIQIIRNLVGDVTFDDLKYIDYSVTDILGIFVPSRGFCKYAITPNHTHPTYMINIFFATENLIVKQNIDVPENYYLGTILSPEIKHKEEKGDKFKRYYAVMIDKEVFEGIYNAYSKKKVPCFFWKQFLVPSDIMFYLKQFEHEYQNKNANYNEILKSIGIIVITKIIRGILNEENEFIPISKVPQIEIVEQYIHENFGQKLSNPQLASIVEMSTSNFIKIFKQELDISPMEYVLKVRIEKAEKYLRSNEKNITEIALICGFNSTSHFSSCFQKYIKETPSNYRKKYIIEKFETK